MITLKRTGPGQPTGPQRGKKDTCSTDGTQRAAARDRSQAPRVAVFTLHVVDVALLQKRGIFFIALVANI